MYFHGQFATNDMMKDYVSFICSQIQTNAGAQVNRADGFPMKGCYVPVFLEILHKENNRAIIMLNSLGHSKEFTFFMSRKKSPAEIMHSLQNKINELVDQIIKENNMDKDKIWTDHHPLKNMKFKITK